MKIAILYICTGNYSVFWADFYKSVEMFFFKNDLKYYFIFTDDDKMKEDNSTTIIKKQCQGFPMDSLFRFDMFLEVEDKVKEFDYVFFFNANMIFQNYVDIEIFPVKGYKGLVCVSHPRGYKYRNHPLMFTYERNIESLAYIPYERNYGYAYYMGGFNGGSVSEYYNMVRYCSNNIKEDYRKGIIAIFHDESHLNKYCFVNSNKVHTLSVAYGYPENSDIPITPIVLIRDKTKVSALFDKHLGEPISKKISQYIKVVFSGLKWKFL